MPIFRNLALTISALVFLHAGTVGCAAQNFEDRILWDPEEEFSIFLPASLASGQELSELPLHEDDISAVLHFSSLSTNPNSTTPRCLSHGSASPAGTHPNAQSLEELVATSQVATLGTVAATVLGWSSQHASPVTMVYVWVEETLHDYGSVGVKDLIAYAVAGGNMYIGDHEICFQPEEVRKVPEIGSEVIVSGNFLLDNPPFVSHAIVLPVENGVVEFPPYSMLKPEPARSYTDLRQELSQLEQRAKDGPK